MDTVHEGNDTDNSKGNDNIAPIAEKEQDIQKLVVPSLDIEMQDAST